MICGFFLQKCQLQAAEKGWSLAWTQLENLFSYFRDIFHCIRPAGLHIVEYKPLNVITNNVYYLVNVIK
jgi:hypothetical protein